MSGRSLLLVIADARGRSPVWRVTREDAADLTARAPSTLTPYEQERCARMIETRARDLRLAAHVLKREAVAAMLGVRAHCLAFVEPADRPVLASPHEGLHVSLSHSRGGVAIALGNSPIGIDIEARHRSRDEVALARRFFHSSECDAVAADASGREFAWRWTAKEALKKASGVDLFDALARPMPSFASTIEAHGARFDFVEPAAGYICAIASLL